MPDITHRLFTKKNLIAILFITVLAIGIYIPLLTQRAKEDNEDMKGKPINFNNNVTSIVPDKTTEAEILQIFGNPTNIKKDDEISKLLLYESNFLDRQNEVYIQEGVVNFVREIISSNNEKNKKSLLDKFGKPTYKLYGPLSNVNIYLHAYPEKGIAFLAKENSDKIIEVWYFPPTMIEDFINRYATDFTFDKESVDIQ